MSKTKETRFVKDEKMKIHQQLRQWHKNIPNLFHGSFRKKWIKALQRKSRKAAVTAKCQW